MVCEDEKCLVKCEFCGKIVQPPAMCSGCGQIHTEMIERGRLEHYLFHHENTLVHRFYNGYWVISRPTSSAKPLKRSEQLIYYSNSRLNGDTVEKAIDTIQIYRILYPNLIPQVLSTHAVDRNKLEPHRYTVTFPVHQTIRSIAEEYEVTMVELLSAFVDFVRPGGEEL